MHATNMNSLLGRFLPGAALALAMVLGTATHAAVPGITTTTGTAAVFNLTASPGRISQPDGASIYMWGYGCTAGQTATTAYAGVTGGFCGTMQIPGPTLIVTEGTTVTVTLTNNLPASAGNTSLLFPGFAVTATGAPGLLTKEAVPGGTATYSFVASSVGTHSYYSGTQGDLQVEMGLSGAIIVLPAFTAAAPAPTCPAHNRAAGMNAAGTALVANGEGDFRLAPAAYHIAQSCYDREYLFQFSEVDPRIHSQVEEQVAAKASCTAGSLGCNLTVETEPYHPNYYMINGRSMPDDMDPIYASAYPNQPYNGNPHMHPGDLTLLRIIGQGRWQHPFHEHGNHVRVLARDGNLLLSQTDQTKLAGPLLFTTTTTPGQAMDGIFYWTGKGLNWDVYGHNPTSSDPNAKLTCTPDANGYNTAATTAINYYEWCGDHNKSLETKPFGDVGSGGPMTLPDPNIVTNGPWYSGSAYLGPNAAVRATNASAIPPSGTVANSVTDEAGFAYMWHSHNEREITTGNIFPGGMLMMMLVDSREFVIDESK